MRSLPSDFIVLTALAQVILMAVTWPLWFSQTEFPRVALVSALAGLPILLDQMLATSLIAGCVILVVQQLRGRHRESFESGSLNQTISSDDSNANSKSLTLLILFCAAALAVLDQHRLQPWHWLTMLLLTQWMLLRTDDFRKTVRVTLATIYMFAALSRIGPNVASGMSGQMLQAILGTVGIETMRPTDNSFFLLATAMNAAEFFIGAALLFDKTRRCGVIGAVLLHGTLSVCLSPIGLNHHVGVLIWNSFLMLAVPVTCWTRIDRKSALSGRATLVTAIVLLIPASGLLGVADNWLAWQVYSPRPEVLKFSIDEESVRFLPESLQQFVQPPQPLQTDCPIRLDRWSLDRKQVPIYPEDRFQIATAKLVVEKSLVNGASREAFKAELEFPNRFPWWNRNSVKVPL